MILSRAPTRITLGGGGTDLESYYSRHGGFLIAGGINKYCNILVNRRFYHDIRLSYSRLEVRDRIEDIEHRIIRAALMVIDAGKGLEVHSTADVPAGCGLGTSSSFTVALLNALHTYRRDFVSQRQLAEEACRIEIEMLGEPIGRQDQFMAAYGGLTCLTFSTGGEVLVEPLRISSESMDQLESSLLLFFTGTERSASGILADQDSRSAAGDEDMMANLHQIKDIGLQTRKHLENGHPEILGEMMHVHWEIKKRRSGKISDPEIDECYELARKNGAIGGKLIGAGGGGFLMLYCENSHKPRLVEAMVARGLRWERFRFDFEGAKILVNA